MVRFLSLENMSTRIRMALLIEGTSISELRIFLHVLTCRCAGKLKVREYQKQCKETL